MTWRLRYALLQVQYRNLKWTAYKLDQAYKRLLNELKKHQS